MFKKFITPVVAALLALATLGATAGAVFAKTNENNEACMTETVKFGQKTTLNAGRDGVFLPASSFSGELEVCRNSSMRPQRSKDQGLVFENAAMSWSVEKNEKANVRFNHGNATVFFDLTSAQQKELKAGTLAIYHWNSPTKTWIKLPTMSVHGTEAAARATGFGFYVLAMESAGAK